MRPEAASGLPPSVPDRLAAAVVAEAVARLEAEGPLDDAQALRQAFRAGGSREQQWLQRAWLLGERRSLPRQWTQLRQLIGWSVLGLGIVLGLLNLGAARNLLMAPDRSINVMAAVLALLAVNWLTLLFWLLGLLRRDRSGGDFSLGRAALALTTRLPIDQGADARLLLASATGVLRRHGLWPWLTGLISHSIWALASLLMLVLLAFGFAFHDYRLSWETTILSADGFQRLVNALSCLPGWFGLPAPDAGAALQTGGQLAADAASQSAWAWWLMACVLAYGLLPRLLLAGLSWWRWHGGQQELARPDRSDPQVLRVLEQLEALEPQPGVLDPEHPQPGRSAAGAVALPEPGTLGLIGFELPPELAWPPTLPQPVSWQLQLGGSMQEREQAWQQLADRPVAGLLLACHGPSSPDRGTARLLRELVPLAGRSALWLLAAGERPVPEAAVQRWRDWMQAEDLDGITVLPDASALGAWLEASHG